MPARKRVHRKRGHKKAKHGPSKAHIPRSLANVPQTAKCVETIVVTDLPSNQMFGSVFSLQDFARARLLSLGYQRVKAAKCTWTYEPLYNTFQEGVAALSIPYMYHRMNRGQDSRVPNTLGDLQAMGAMPKKFSNTVKISYKPNWVSPGLIGYTTRVAPASSGGTFLALDGITAYGAKREYGWLENSPYNQTQDITGNVIIPVGISRRIPGTDVPFTPSFLTSYTTTQMQNVQSGLCVYNGHDVFFDQKVVGSADLIICRVTLTVEWHFRDPVWWDRVIQTNTLVNP